jgi:predicted GNAT family acetyltransferase
MTELQRALDFIAKMADDLAQKKVPSRYGVALLAPEFPSVWSRNYLYATEELDTASAEELAAEANRLLGQAGLRHRKVEVWDAEAGVRLEPGFVKLGWNRERDVIMVVHREPDRLVDTSSVHEVGADDLVPTWTESWALDPAVLNSDVARQLVENKRRLGVETNTRFFAARVDGEVGAYCELYSDGQTAQIENVFTLDRFRKRGLARAVVSKALEVAQGHELIFLIADQDDWPKELYRKLGFDDVGLIWEFILPRAG